MALRRNVPQHLKHCNFSTIVPRNGVVTLYGYGINVHVDRGHLTIADGIGIDRAMHDYPSRPQASAFMVVVGADGVISLAALRWLSDQDAAFVMLDRDGSVTVITVVRLRCATRRAQSLAQDSGTA